MEQGTLYWFNKEQGGSLTTTDSQYESEGCTGEGESEAPVCVCVVGIHGGGGSDKDRQR